MHPIFIISMPRAGSSLLNRLLASHRDIASYSEPWFILPLVHMSNPDSAEAIYSHSASSRAINDIISSLKDTERDWNAHLREFSQNIYKSLAKLGSKTDAIYFIDKTPRYHTIVKELSTIFPDAKFIILVRNPLSCLASGITTWGKGQLRLHGQMIDLLEGPKNLAYAINNLGTRACKVKYEDLTQSPTETLHNIFTFLGLESSQYDLEEQAVLNGTMGDPIENNNYRKSVVTDNISKYKSTLGTYYRKIYARRYVKSINKNDLATLGYPESGLQEEIDSLPNSIKYLVSDICINISAYIWRVLDIGYLRKRMLIIKSKNNVYIHN